MQLFNNVELLYEDVSMYAPEGVNWHDHFKSFFQFQSWNDRTEKAWLFRMGKHRLTIVKEKPDAIAKVLIKAQQQADKTLIK
jgi:hypothetical protein